MLRLLIMSFQSMAAIKLQLESSINHLKHHLAHAIRKKVFGIEGNIALMTML